MKEKWQKLERWLAANAPKVLEGLNPPATEAEITAAETAINMSLPPSVRKSYQVHNGRIGGVPNAHTVCTLILQAICECLAGISLLLR